jgi:hypothetical protein
MENKSPSIFFYGWRIVQENLVKYKDLKHDEDLFFLLSKAIKDELRNFQVLRLSEQVLLLGYPVIYLNPGQKVKQDSLILSISISERTRLNKAWEQAELIQKPSDVGLELYFV